MDALRESLASQTFPAREVIIANTSESVDSASALAEAAARATAPLLLFVGSGDILAPDALFRFAEAFASADDPAFVYASGLLVRNGFRFNPSHVADIVSVLPRPDFSLDAFRGHDFIGRVFACLRDRFERAGGFRSGMGSAATTDLLFRLCECGGTPVRIGQPLCAETLAIAQHPFKWRDWFRKERAADACRALEEHLARTGADVRMETPCRDLAFFRIRPPRPNPAPLVSVLIPNRENPEVLRVCVESILRKTSYPNYEIVITESGSTGTETFALYDRLSQDPHVHVVRFPKKPDEPFNYSRKCNFGAKHCRGDFLLLLNSDTEAIAPDWIDEMLGFAARSDVGVVGALLIFGEGTVQHAGLMHRAGGLPDHIERRVPALSPGVAGRLLHVQEYQAVTFACAMVRTSVWRELGGLDESFAVAFNDVDFCYRVREHGLKVVWTPFAKLFHHESLVRGSDHVGPNRKRFLGEIAHLRQRWGALLARPDPFFDDLVFTTLPKGR